MKNYENVLIGVLLFSASVILGSIVTNIVIRT